MESPTGDANPPPLQRIELSSQSTSNATTINSNTNGLQETLETLLLRMSSMETSIINLQTKQVQEHPGAPPRGSNTVREQDRLSLHAPVDQELTGGDKNPSVEEFASCTSEFNPANPASPGYIKETANQSVVAALFNRMQPDDKTPSRKRSTSGSGSSASASKKQKVSEGIHQGDRLDVGNEVIKEIVYEKVAPQASGPPILENLSKACTKFWITESKNEQVVKKLKSDYPVPSNCKKNFSPILNEEILKNKDIHSFYKRNDRRWFDLQNLILKSSTAVMNIANICLDADNKNRIIESKEVVVKAIDTITLLGRASQQITFERKERLKPALSEDY